MRTMRPIMSGEVVLLSLTPEPTPESAWAIGRLGEGLALRKTFIENNPDLLSTWTHVRRFSPSCFDEWSRRCYVAINGPSSAWPLPHVLDHDLHRSDNVLFLSEGDLTFGYYRRDPDDEDDKGQWYQYGRDAYTCDYVTFWTAAPKLPSQNIAHLFL